MLDRLVSLFKSSDELQKMQAQRPFEVLDVDYVNPVSALNQSPYHLLQTTQAEEEAPLPSSISMQIISDSEGIEAEQVEQKSGLENPDPSRLEIQQEDPITPLTESVDVEQVPVLVSALGQQENPEPVEQQLSNVRIEIIKNTIFFAFATEGLWMTSLIISNLVNLQSTYGQTWKGVILGTKDDPDLYPYPNALADHFWQDRPDQSDYFTNIALSLITPFMLGAIYAAATAKKLNHPESSTPGFVKALLYLLFPLGVLGYTRAIYSLINKIEIQKIYKENKRQCEASGKTYDYIDALGDYLCNVCGAWEDLDVYLKDIANPQKCLDAVLSKPLTPKAISNYLDTFSKFTGYTTLDFSEQDYGSWNTTDFENLIQKFKAMNMSLDLFSLAKSNVTSYAAMTETKIDILTNFINATSIRTLSKAGNYFGAPLEKRFFEGLKNVTLDSLILSSTNLDVTTQQSVPNLRASNVNLEKNQLTEKNARKLLNNIEAATVINLSDNPLGDATLIDLGNLHYKDKIEAVDISDFAEITSEGIPHLKSLTSLKYLKVAGNSLENDDLVTLAESLPVGVIGLDISRNSLDQSQTAKRFFKKLLPTLKKLNLSDTNFGDSAAPYLATYLTHSSTEVLDLSYSQLSVENFKLVIMSIISSNLNYLKLNSAKLSVDHIAVLAEIFSTHKHKIKVIELSNNSIGDESGYKLIEAFKLSGVETFDISSNLITTYCGLAIAEAIPHSNFTKINISRTFINGTAIIAIIDAKKLQSLIADQTTINYDDALTITKKLLNYRYDLSFIKNKPLSPFEKRMLSQAEPATPLQELSLINCGLTTDSKRILSRVAPAAGFSFGALRVDDFVEPTYQHESRYLTAKNFTGSWEPNVKLPLYRSEPNNTGNNNDLILHLTGSLLFIFFLLQLCKKCMIPSSKSALQKNSFFAITLPANDSTLIAKITKRQGM